MRRREFIAILGVAAALQLDAHAQRGLPVVGFLRSTPAAPFSHLLAAFRSGLSEAGFVEGRNVVIEQRWANNDPLQLPRLAAELVQLGVSVIVGNGAAAQAAKEESSTIPIIFVIADDPVTSGFVASLNRPGGNLTGLTFFGAGQLAAKRIELLRDLVPSASSLAVLLDPNYRGFDDDLSAAETAGQTLGIKVIAAKARDEAEFATAFNEIVKAGAKALLVSGGPVFTSFRKNLVDMAAKHRLPAAYDQRDFVVEGGLMSYAASFTAAYYQAGVYAGQILKGARPSQLPVLQPTTFELAINLKTAKSLGLAVPPALLARADEVIE